MKSDPLGDGTPYPTTDLWNQFTPTSQEALVQGHIGDFEGFQTQLEGLFVSRTATGDRDRPRVGGFADTIGSCVVRARMPRSM